MDAAYFTYARPVRDVRVGAPRAPCTVELLVRRSVELCDTKVVAPRDLTARGPDKVGFCAGLPGCLRREGLLLFAWQTKGAAHMKHSTTPADTRQASG